MNAQTKLTKAQTALLTATEKAGVYAPFGYEWKTVYSLRPRGLIEYANRGSIFITPAGRAALSKAGG